MKTSFRKSFTRDLKKIKDDSVLKKVADVIDAIESASHLGEISGLKKLSGADDCFRIRIGDYRLGIVVEEDLIEFVRCLNRRDLYRYFP